MMMDKAVLCKFGMNLAVVPKNSALMSKRALR